MKINEIQVGMDVVCAERKENESRKYGIVWAQEMDAHIGKKMEVVVVDTANNLAGCVWDGAFTAHWYHLDWLEPWEERYV